ncbi:MAG TPA: sialate O-acetylesterase [Tepidisphaeraceae bacterium]|jgi:sialate O-acetylesterase|nr:sialate O-acetylesterase [Tepidisphaeraceae bacterium]
MNMSIVASVAALALSSVAVAAVELPAIISDNMVLQRSAKTPLWGTADAGEKIKVTFNNVTADTVADDKGKWRVNLDLESMAANGPFDLTIAGTNTITVRNVLVGEVWLCSGQSNMEWSVANSNDAKNEIAAANFPEIRQFRVKKVIANEPMQELSGTWVAAAPSSIPSFTAVGYYFGREVHQKTGKPVGLINSSWGGTIAEAWTSEPQLKTDERYHASIERRNQTAANPEKAMAKYKAETEAWERRNADTGANKGEEAGWMNADHDTSDWKSMELPIPWQQADVNHNGIIWFRKTIDVPTGAAGKPATLALGAIDDFDTTYVNGKEVGKTGVSTPNFWSHPRKYELPVGTLKAGKNVIAVRVVDIGGHGGFYGPADAMKLTTANGDQALTGPWQYTVERVIDPKTIPPRPAEPATKSPNQPAVLYNGMIAPVVPYGIRGAIWYQGESNAGRPAEYADLMKLLVEGWRKDWDRGDFSFYIVQLANFMKRSEQPNDTNWAKLRQAQAEVAHSLPNSGLAVTIDIGDEKDIHPRNKQDVGKRLSAIALAKDYGQDVEYAGPTFENLGSTGDKLRVRFSHADGLTTTDGAAPKGFAVAGDDGKFVWADAKIDGQAVVLSAEGVESPTSVRYAWGDNPEVNLKNAAGFPAVPFKATK